MNIRFIQGEWEDKLQYACTSRFASTAPLVQEADCVRNSLNADIDNGFDYTTLFTKDMYSAGVRISCEISFENFGAPLIAWTDNLWQDKDGVMRHSTCHEVVLYENGINVWRLTEGENGKVDALKVLAARFPVESGKKHTLTVQILEKYIEIEACGRSYLVYLSDIPERFYVGITACENIDRLYSFTIE